MDKPSVAGFKSKHKIQEIHQKRSKLASEVVLMRRERDAKKNESKRLRHRVTGKSRDLEVESANYGELAKKKLAEGKEEIEFVMRGQLLRVLDNIKADPKIYPEILKQLAEKNPIKFKSEREVERYLESATTDADAVGVAKLIDLTLGSGTFRTLSFLDKKGDSAKSVFKLLKHNIEGASFEKQVERGHYLNLLETYGVQWNLEKVSRDSVQNFFDANGGTLDGVHIETSVEEKKDVANKKTTKIGRVIIKAPQDYDWRELIHFGGTTKQDSETSVGGFGEGLKVASFVLLKDQGATTVRAASRDWELEYYFDSVASESYRKPVKGLHAKKRTRDSEPGNYLEIVFEGEDADKKVKVFEEARELFFSSQNPDFWGASFDNKATGGFKVLSPDLKQKYSHLQRQTGRLYLAGQRTHFDSRDKWENVSDLNIWTWKKIQPKDRDRGMITRQEMGKDVIPLIVESMSIEQLKKSVYDFKDLWDGLEYFNTSYTLLESIVDRLAKEKINLQFEKQYLASDLPFGDTWIGDALVSKGFKLCVPFLKKIGMKGATEQFKEWQSHDRTEATSAENSKISILQKAAKILGLSDDELKEVWIFSAREENSVMHGQYNPMFYWMAREALNEPFSDALHTYVHEAAHKEGPHGNAKFDYTLQDYIQRIHRFILDHKKEWDLLEGEWKTTNK